MMTVNACTFFTCVCTCAEGAQSELILARNQQQQQQESESNEKVPLPGGAALPHSAQLANGSLKGGSLSARYPAPSSEITPWYFASACACASACARLIVRSRMHSELRLCTACRDSIRTLCNTMRNQILSRAFNGCMLSLPFALCSALT